MHGLKNDFNNECKESRLILCEISKVFDRVLAQRSCKQNGLFGCWKWTWRCWTKNMHGLKHDFNGRKVVSERLMFNAKWTFFPTISSQKQVMLRCDDDDDTYFVLDQHAFYFFSSFCLFVCLFLFLFFSLFLFVFFWGGRVIVLAQCNLDISFWLNPSLILLLHFIRETSNPNFKVFGFASI